MKWVASNCGCGDPIEVSRSFQAQHCDYFEMPIITDYRSKAAWRRRVRGLARSGISYLRAKKYAQLSKEADVVHFQQILNSYGSNAVFHWLKQPSISEEHTSELQSRGHLVCRLLLEKKKIDFKRASNPKYQWSGMSRMNKKMQQ